MILYDWECTKKHKFEEMASSDTKEIPCPKCRTKAVRLVSAPLPVLDGTSGEFPGAAMKWERQHQAKNYT